MYVCVFGCDTIEKYKQQLIKIMNTWGKRAEEKNVTVLYFVGEEVTDLEHPNLIHLPNVANDHMSASYKQNLGLKYIMDNYNCNFVFVCGTDTYINIDKLLLFIDKFDKNDKLYIGGDGIYDYVNKQYYYHSGGAGFILSKKSLQYLYPYLETMVNTWTKICNMYRSTWLVNACDCCISYYLQNGFMTEDEITKNNESFFSCNYKGYVLDKQTNVVDITKIISCHYMTLQDFDDYTTILKNNNYYR